MAWKTKRLWLMAVENKKVNMGHWREKSCGLWPFAFPHSQYSYAYMLRGREGQTAMNPVEKSPKPCRNSLRTPWKISEPCKEQKMCYSGGNRMIFEFFSTYGTGSNKSITNKCNFDLIHGSSICLFCIPFLSLNFKMDLRNNAQCF